MAMVAAFAILGVSGCASTGGLKTGCVRAAGDSSDNAWWYASFRINWPDDQEISLDADLLIAHRIISPVLDRYRQNIALWRFHRRAARDDAGHRFSFIFYTTAATARKIYAEIGSSAVLGRMKTDGVILEVSFDDTSSVRRSGVEATSDRNWSPPLQKAWPYFIMGVSQTWLDLIDQYAGDGRKKPVTSAEMMEFYHEIARQIEATWNKEGGHAFLHHLNALFGYGPVNLRGKIEMQF